MKANNLTKGAILVSINIILFYMSKIFDVLNLTLLTITSVITCLSIIKFNVRSSVLIIVSSSISSIILGLIEYSLFYFLFFGTYPLFKFFIENLNNIIIEIILKLIYFNTLFLLIYFIYSKLFIMINLNFYILLIWCISGTFIFILYDLFLTKIIRFVYNNPLIRKL